MNLQIVSRLLLVFAVLAQGNAVHAQDTRVDEYELLEALATPNLVRLTLEGTVHLPGGTPAVGAVVVSTAGGQAITDEHGEYRLETRVAREAKRLQVTAVGGTGGKLVASTQVTLTGVAASARFRRCNSRSRAVALRVGFLRSEGSPERMALSTPQQCSTTETDPRSMLAESSQAQGEFSQITS